MNHARKISVYAQIASEIIDKINKGFFANDNKLPSRNDICIKYNVSDMTAWKVHNELERLGAAYKVRGEGIYACHKPAATDKPELSFLCPVKKVVFFSYKQFVSNSGHCENKIHQGVQTRAFELGLSIRTEFFSSETKGSFQISEDEGLIIPYNSGCEWLLPMMERKRIRSVIINNYFSEAYSILNDNYSGISQLLDYLESQKCRNIILATKHFNSLGMANLSERTYAFENECKRRRLKHKVLTNGNFNELIEIVKCANKPDAVMFTSDDPAMKFREMLLKEKTEKLPIITGFDNLSPETGTDNVDVTTIKVDYEGMGAAAVDLMLNNTLEDWHLPDVVRVPCNLAINI